MWGYILALISGALMSVQGVFNSEVTKETNVWIAAAFVQFSAFIVCTAAWFMTGRGSSIAALFHISQKYMLLGGIMGAFITYTVIQSVNNLGPAKSVMFILISQLLIAYLIELFGLFGIQKVDFEWRKVVGMLLIIGGVIAFKWE
ncbi:MAG: DMT family transporter [Velocimicrobium sp.]